MQVDCVSCNLADGIVLAENEFGSLLIVFIRFGLMPLALLAELVRAGTVSLLVCLARFGGVVLMLALLLPSEIAEPIIFALGIGRGAVVEVLTPCQRCCSARDGQYLL